MARAADRPFPEAPPAAAAELLGRVLLALTYLALLYGLASPLVRESGGSAQIEFVVGLRVVLFGVTALAAMLIQGARATLRSLAAASLVLLALALALGPEPAGQAGDVRDLLSVQVAVLAAVLWGTWLARLLERPGHLLVVVLCAAAGDAWLNVLKVPESVGPLHPIRMLRLSWPPALEGLYAAPTFADLMFLALYLEAARRFRFKLSSVALGAAAAYGVASLMSMASMKIMLSLPLVGLGVLMGAWPRFRCTAADVLQAFVLALALFLALLGLTTLKRGFQPVPERPLDPQYLRRVAGARAPFPRHEKTDGHSAVRSVARAEGSAGYCGIRTRVPTLSLLGSGKLFAAINCLGGTPYFRATAYSVSPFCSTYQDSPPVDALSPAEA
ncbi:MAG: hypothetical protein M5U26_12335 [Planctomycetota bacterium]|nr:hypothetical protein [Planctomycetota bacterium]